MKTLEIDEKTDGLVRFARKNPNDTVFLTRKGKTVAAVMLVKSGEAPPASLLNDTRFMKMIEESRASLRKEGGISSEEILAELGLDRREAGTRKTRQPKVQPHSGRNGR